MAVELQLYFELEPNAEQNEFQQHIALVRQLQNTPHLRFHSARLYQGSFFEPCLIETIQAFDESIAHRLGQVHDTNLVLVSRFEARRLFNAHRTEVGATLQLKEESILVEMATFGKKSKIVIPFGHLNSWWWAGSLEQYEPHGSKRTWRENRSRLMTELEIVAKASNNANIRGGGAAWPEHICDLYFASISHKVCDIYALLELAEQFGSIEVEERDEAIFIYSRESWKQQMQVFFEQSAARLGISLN